MHVENATVLLLIAEIHKRSGNGVLGIPYALASLSFCQSFNLDLLRASATLTLAELWLLLGSRHAKRALNLTHSAFPIILGQSSLELQSRAYIAEAKCYLLDSTILVSEDPDVVLDSLRPACEGLEALEDAIFRVVNAILITLSGEHLPWWAQDAKNTLSFIIIK